MAKKRKVWPWVLGAGVVAVGVGYWFYRKKKQQQTAAAEAWERAGGYLPYVPGGIMPTVPGAEGEGGSVLDEILRWLQEGAAPSPAAGPMPLSVPSKPTAPGQPPAAGVTKAPPPALTEIKIIQPTPGTKSQAVFAPTTALEMAKKGILPGEAEKQARAAAPEVAIPSPVKLIAIPAAMKPEEQLLMYKPGVGWVRTTSKVVPSVLPATPSAAAKMGTGVTTKKQVSIV
ncbi:MAG: hypothetical protein QXQ53_03825 [Candidatus Methanosuratincola sp.]